MAMTAQQARRMAEQLGQLVAADAAKHFDTISPVRRVVIKANPATFGEFVLMAILTNEQRFEGRTLLGQRRFDWCLTPNCNCKCFIALKSPLEIGVTIDD